MPTSPLRIVPDEQRSRMVVANQLSAADTEQMQHGADSQLQRGWRAGSMGISAGAFANEAIAAERAGDPNWQTKRDLGLRMAQEAAEVGPRVTSLRDIQGVGDAVDWATGGFGQGVASMAPTVAAALLTRGRGNFGKATAFGGAMIPAYQMEKGESVLGQYADPTLAATDVGDRMRAAEYKGMTNAALESIVPAGLAGSILRKPTTSFLGAVGRNALTEGATEAAQTYTGHLADKSLDPNRQFDPMTAVDAAALGALTGGGVSAVGLAPTHAVNALGDRVGSRPPNTPPEAAPPPVAEPLAPAPAPQAPPGQFEEVLNNAKERFGPKLQDTYATAKDYVSAFAERANEAIKTAQNPGDFVRQVFSPSAEEQAQSILQPEHEDPTVLNAADPAAGLADRDARNATSAADLAGQLMDDPATPQFIRDKIDSMGGDYSSKANQAYVASTLLGVKGGKKIVDAVGDFVAFSKELASKAGTIAGDLKTGLTDKVSKKNLQDIHESDIQPLVNLLAKKLGPTGGAQAPQLAKQLVAAANRLSPNGQINEAVDRRLRNFSEAIDDETLDMVTELSGSDALSNSIAKIRAIPSAMSDVRQAGGNSFLESLITVDEARQYLPRIAEAVDELALAGAKSSPARESMLNGLADGVFGSVENAQTVVEYYGKMRRSAYKLEAEQAKVREDRDAVDPDMLPGESVATLEGADGLQTLGTEFGTLTEQDAKEMDATYRDPNPARPFFRSTDHAELRKARREAPAGSRVATLREHTAQTGEAPQFVAARLRADLRKRLADSENRDTATVQQAIKDLDTIPEEMRDDSFHTLYKSLKTRKTENRSDLPKLRAQMEAVEKASGVSFKDITAISKRIRRAELADEGGIESDDIAELPKLKKELAKLEAKYAKNADKVLEKFAVVMKPKDETYASDDHVAKFRGILDKRKAPPTRKKDESLNAFNARKAEVEDHNTKIKKTAIKFNRKDGKTPITLSAESMVYSSQAQGSVQERFFDSVAAMLARPDIEGMVPPAADTLIVRKTGLTWGDIVPEFVENFVPSVWKRAAQRDKENTKAWGKEQRLLADIDTRPKLMAAIRQLQKQYLADQLGLTIAKDEPLSLNDLIERFPAGQRKEMRTAANDAAFEAALGWAKTLSRKNAAATQRNFTDESKQRVLEKYIDEQLEDRYPTTYGDERVSQRLAAEDQDAGLYADEGNVGGAILDAEANLEMLEDRLDAVQGIAGLERKYERMVDAQQADIDRLADTVPDPEQRDVRAQGSRSDESIDTKGERLIESTKATNARVSKQNRQDAPTGLDFKNKRVQENLSAAGIFEWQDPELTGWGARNRHQAYHDAYKKYLTPEDTMAAARAQRMATDQFMNSEGQAYINKIMDSRVPGGSFRAYISEQMKGMPTVQERAWAEQDGDGQLKAEWEKLKPAEKFAANTRRIAKEKSDAAFKARMDLAGVPAEFRVRDSSDIGLETPYKYRDDHHYSAEEVNGKFALTYTPIIEPFYNDEREAYEPDEADALDAEMAAKEEKFYKDNPPQELGSFGSIEAAEVAASKHLMKTVGPASPNDDGSFDEPKSNRAGYKQTTVGKAKKPPNAKDHAELKKKILEEIRRTRGDEVRLRFNRLIKHIGASGEFSMNEDKTDRLIEIAVNAADPMGVAWHESLHDFFAMLGEDKSSRSIKRDLVNASNAPQVKKRLRELLKDHPEALKQLEESPEERVAYMYQFWAAGDPKLRVGPLGTGTFEKIRAFFRDLFRLVGRHERAQDLMAALHEGKFADTRVVAEVLADMPRDTINNRMERMAPALKDTLDKMVQTAPDRLRDFQNEHISSLADRMEKFIQRRNQRDGEWTNKLAGILDGTTATQRRAALENMQAMKPPSSPLEHKLAKFFKDMHGYMTDAKVKTLDSKTKQWVPLREVTNYFPRVFDRAALEKDPDGFVKLLMQHGKMTEASARNTLKALTHGTGQIELAENEHALGFSPYAQAVQDRQLEFIDPSNAAEFAKYQSKDLPDITASYVKQAVHRAEYARDFGNRGEEIAKVVARSGVTDKKDLEDINKIVMGLEGTLGYQMSSQTKELFSGILTLQNLVILPLAIFSQVVDPIVLAARSGDLRDAGNAYVTALKKLTRQADVDGEDIAEMLGIISQDTVLEAMGVAYGTTHMSKRMRNINRVFFKWNGMQGWNNAMRIAATAAGERYLLQNKDNPAALKELGLEPSDIKTKVSFMGKPNAQNKVVGKERLDVSDPKVKEAMFKFVDQAVLRPSAANRPVWMSDPKFLLVAHLKQFTFAMHNVVLKRANEQLDEGNPKPWLILALTMPAILAADMAKFALTGGPPPGWGFKEFLGHAVERSGLLGLGDFGAQATQGVGQGKMPGEALLGPSFEHLMELLRFLLGAPGVDSTDVIDRTVPGARFV